MRLVFGFVLLVGIGLAGAAVYMARDFFAQQQLQLAEAEAAKLAIVPTAEVYVLNKQMRYGQRLTMEDVKKVRWPEEAIPEGAFTSEEQLFPKGPDLLRSILRTMEPDEAVMAIKVTEPGQDAGVSSRLSAGMRAFAIQTDVTSGVSGFLRPGDRVDVYWTGNTSSGNVTKLIQANIRLVAINQSADEDRNSPTVARVACPGSIHRPLVPVTRWRGRSGRVGKSRNRPATVAGRRAGRRGAERRKMLRDTAERRRAGLGRNPLHQLNPATGQRFGKRATTFGGACSI